MLCQKCRDTLPKRDEFGSRENTLVVSFSGGYGEFIDSIDDKPEYSLRLCHKCGHELLSYLNLKRSISSKSHKKTDEKFCDGY